MTSECSCQDLVQLTREDINLHEVIRLSGMNLIIDDFDHQLIIKVASIQKLRLQVYFIDNEEFFPRRQMFHDHDGNFMDNNDERMMFYCKRCD